MNTERELRSKRKQVADNNNKSKINKSTSTVSATPPTTSATNKKGATVVHRPSLTATSRLSTSNKTTAVPGPPKNSLENRIILLESRLSTIEESFERLIAENSELKGIVANLNSELVQVKSRNERNQSPTEVTTLEQQEINSNIVIRGVDVSANTTASELDNIYEGIRNHLENLILSVSTCFRRTHQSPTLPSDQSESHYHRLKPKSNFCK